LVMTLGSNAVCPSLNIEGNRFGEMVALKGNRITSVPLQKVADGIKTIDMGVYKVAKIFFFG